MSHSNFFLLLK